MPYRVYFSVLELKTWYNTYTLVTSSPYIGRLWSFSLYPSCQRKQHIQVAKASTCTWWNLLGEMSFCDLGYWRQSIVVAAWRMSVVISSSKELLCKLNSKVLVV